MKGIIPFLVVIALLMGGGGLMFTSLDAQRDENTFFRKVHKQQVAFVEQVAVTRLVPEDKFKFDRAQLISWHASQIKKLYKEHPKQDVPDRFLVELEEKEKEKKKKDAAKKERFEKRYEWLKNIWDKTVSTGDYDTVLAQQKNGMWLEILDISPWVPPEGGKRSLKMDLLLWGPVHDHISFKGIEIQFLREIPPENGRGKPKKAIAKIEGGGPPNVLHPSGPNPAPEKWILEWPPGTSVGYYAGLPLLPPDATAISFKIGMDLRTYGGSTVPLEFSWQNIPVKDEWKSEDAVWDADVGEATEEELAAAGIK
jgi:hypothetical protein